MTPQLHELLEEIAQGLVNHELEVSVLEDKHSVIVTVEPHPDDFGMLIGKKGMYADAIRKLWSACYGKIGKRFTLNVVDPRRRASHRSR
jgi:predicted RNA-binding protein YlqC (UPF0109 family)